jgi:hypothetical protein
MNMEAQPILSPNMHMLRMIAFCHPLMLVNREREKGGGCCGRRKGMLATRPEKGEGGG